MIRTNNPGSLLQFYLTWGRPYGEADLCAAHPNGHWCTYDKMQNALTASYTTFACMNKPGR